MPEALVTEQVTVGASPGSPSGDVAPSAGVTSTVSARLDREYVAGRYPEILQNYLRTLPAYIDDLTADFGDDIYERILLDAHVAAEVTVLKSSILETGVNLAPAKPDEADDGHDLSVTIRDAAERMLDDLSTPLDDALWSMADAIALGNKVAELTFRYDSSYVPGKTLLVLDKIAVKPRHSTSFLVDAYQNVPGLLAAIPGVAWTAYNGLTVTDVSRLPNFLPREKFAVWTYRPKDGNPLGTSILRPIYNPWWLKTQLYGEYLKYLTQFASASIVGFASEKAQNVPDPNDPSKMLTPQQAMLASLEQLRNGSVAAFPFGALVQMLSVSGEGQAFLHAFGILNREITKGILTQALATEEGQHQARAASQVHQDVLDTLVRQGKRSLVRMVKFDMLRPWVRHNWGDAALPLTPVVTLGEGERTDFSKEATAVAALQTSGFFDDSQMTGLDDYLDLPPRDPDWIAQRDAKTAALTPPPAPAQPPPANPQPAQPAPAGVAA